MQKTKKIIFLLVISVLTFNLAEAQNTVVINVSCTIPPLVGVNVPEKESLNNSILKEERKEENKEVIVQEEEKIQQNKKVIITSVVVK